MVFSSLIFTFYFLPVVLLLYYVAGKKYQNYILLAASLLFYAYGEPHFVLVMLASIIINYSLALWIARTKQGEHFALAKLLLVLDIILNLGILFVFKYLDFSISIIQHFLPAIQLSPVGISLPIGISFFTFQALSYVVDVYRGTVAVQTNPLYVALYISFFPQLVAGPIVRYSTIEHQMTHRVHSLEKFSEGARRFMLGFCKKILLANNLSLAVSSVQSMDPASANPLTLWIGAICYSLQIFFDFSGYSDMAIGLGRMFGFEFEENFNYPYISGSITEFWRRWHISLGQWFRDYVYFPLGGSRVSVPRHILNLLIVWTLTGIWHGANLTFVVWGLGYFVLLVLEKYIIKPWQRKNVLFQIAWHIITLLCINFGWVFFNASTITEGLRYCLGMLGHYHIIPAMDGTLIRLIREYGIYILSGILFSIPVVPALRKKTSRYTFCNYLDCIIGPMIYAILFLWAVSFLILGAHNPFIYFNF